MKISIRKPDDFHVHLRTGEMLKNVIEETTKVFARGLAMGNLVPPIATADDAKKYQEEILAAAPGFQPIMSIMLVKKTTPEIVEEASANGVKVLKWIPGATSTNSDDGVAFSELENYYAVLEKAQELGMIFSGHWEKAVDDNGGNISELEREAAAIPHLDEIVRRFPELKIVVEHATTRRMVEYINDAPKSVAGTLTLHHAILTKDDVFRSDDEIKDPYCYCKPVAKTKDDKNAIVDAMVSGNPKFFFGSDSAPHPVEKKEAETPAAGIFSAPLLLPGLAQIFGEEDRLDRLDDFVSKFGAQFYGLPLNEGTVELVKEKWTVPEIVGDVKVFMGGKELEWRLS